MAHQLRYPRHVGAGVYETSCVVCGRVFRGLRTVLEQRAAQVSCDRSAAR